MGVRRRGSYIRERNMDVVEAKLNQPKMVLCTHCCRLCSFNAYIIQELSYHYHWQSVTSLGGQVNEYDQYVSKIFFFQLILPILPAEMNRDSAHRLT
jgi:hypothetical protein